MSLGWNLTIEDDVTRALEEDLGGTIDPALDVTAQLIPADKTINARIITREDGIICGREWAHCSFSMLDPGIELQWHVNDGDHIHASQTLVNIAGNARCILTAERTALNFLQMLSGTATQAHRYAQLLSDSPTKVLDTRKTIPGFRQAQKYAVKCGGGHNHRMGLYDAFLIKENHISACGGIGQAVSRARVMCPGKLIEVEVESIDELMLAIDARADIVMLDNFNPEQIQRAVSINNQRCKLEVSGNITDDTLVELAELGVDYISSGALTKHLKALDLSLLVV